MDIVDEIDWIQQKQVYTFDEAVDPSEYRFLVVLSFWELGTDLVWLVTATPDVSLRESIIVELEIILAHIIWFHIIEW
jgi:hypothetical protein